MASRKKNPARWLRECSNCYPMVMAFLRSPDYNYLFVGRWYLCLAFASQEIQSAHRRYGRRFGASAKDGERFLRWSKSIRSTISPPITPASAHSSIILRRSIRINRSYSKHRPANIPCVLWILSVRSAKGSADLSSRSRNPAKQLSCKKLRTRLSATIPK